MDHYVHILGFEHPVKVTDDQEKEIRNIVIGADVIKSFISIGTETRTILVRTGSITALESRPKGSGFTFAKVSNR
jgi:hypothetical protein